MVRILIVASGAGWLVLSGDLHQPAVLFNETGLDVDTEECRFWQNVGPLPVLLFAVSTNVRPPAAGLHHEGKFLRTSPTAWPRVRALRTLRVLYRAANVQRARFHCVETTAPPVGSNESL
jgi:hypothetical protein